MTWKDEIKKRKIPDGLYVGGYLFTVEKRIKELIKFHSKEKDPKTGEDWTPETKEVNRVLVKMLNEALFNTQDLLKDFVKINEYFEDNF